MKQRQRCSRAILPFLGATLYVSASLVAASFSASANTLGTLSIPSGGLPADTGTDIGAAILNSSASRLGVVGNRIVRLAQGDTLAGVLSREGVPASQREAALRALGDLFDPSNLKPGDEIELSMRAGIETVNAPSLIALHVRTGRAQDLTILAGADGLFHPASVRPNADSGKAGTARKSWSVDVTTRKGSVKHGLHADLLAAQVPSPVADDVVAAFTWDPDIPANPSKGTKFAVVYESATAQDAAPRHVLRYAELSIYGQQHRVYRYETGDGTVAYMDEDGRGVMPLHLGSPVRKGKMTSPFGWRVHPVLKVRKFHKGVDYAAPKGTPVYAAEDGVIEDLGWRGNYGRYLRVSHNARVATAYAHLSKFAPGLRPGSRVQKGQVIAYIGASGLATGNHLYYEVLVDKKQVDPLRPDVMVQVNLDGSSLDRFRTYVAQLGQAERP